MNSGVDAAVEYRVLVFVSAKGPKLLISWPPSGLEPCSLTRLGPAEAPVVLVSEICLAAATAVGLGTTGTAVLGWLRRRDPISAFAFSPALRGGEESNNAANSFETPPFLEIFGRAVVSLTGADELAVAAAFLAPGRLGVDFLGMVFANGRTFLPLFKAKGVNAGGSAG